MKGIQIIAASAAKVLSIKLSWLRTTNRRKRNWNRFVSFASFRQTARVSVCLSTLYAVVLQSVCLTSVQANSLVHVKTQEPLSPFSQIERSSSVQASLDEKQLTVFKREYTKAGKLSRYADTFTLPTGVAAPFILYVTNGLPDGSGRVIDGIIKINGVVVISSGELNPQQPSIIQKILLSNTNLIEVEFFSGENALLSVAINASIRTSSGPPPVITSVTPERGIPGTEVFISGSRLLPSLQSARNLVVTFTGPNNTRKAAQIAFASSTLVRAKVPTGSITGIIELINTDGRATSGNDFDVDPTTDFAIVLNPSTVIAVQRASGIVVAAVASVRNDFTQLANLSVKGLPQGVTYAFTPPQATAGTTSTLTVNLANANLAAGSYNFAVNGSAMVDGNQVLRSAPATLNVIQAGQTTLTGRVLSTEKEPVVGAAVSLDGKTTVTDVAGVFLLTGITAGANRPVQVDGRTAFAPGRKYPVITEPATVVAGQANVVPFIFYLPPIDTQYEVEVVANQTTVATNPRLPTLEMAIPPNSNLRNRDGSAVFAVSITPLAIDRTPAPLPSNIGTSVVYTSQPGGAIADKPMPVVYPNLAGLSPGTTHIPLYAFNHDTVQWYIYGFGKVSSNGKTIEPEINPSTGQLYGLLDFSWHFPAFPPPRDLGGDGAVPPCEGCASCDGNENGDGKTNSPVDLATGEKFEEAIDISFGGGRGELELKRIYTISLGNTCTTCPFGRGFTHNYDYKLTGTFQVNGAGRLIRPGDTFGKLFSYERTDNDGSLVFASSNTSILIGDVLRKLTNGTFEYKYRDGSAMGFDATGRLILQRDRNGNTITLTYTGNNLTQITDPVGRSISLVYAGTAITRATDPLGRVWGYTYSVGQLTQVKDPQQQITTYGYNGPGRLGSIVDPRGVTVKQITYDAAGRVSRQDFAHGASETYAYILAGNVITSTTVTDSLNRVAVKRFNPAGYIIERVDGLGLVSKVERNLQSNLMLQTLGSCGCTEVTREYDQRGNITKVTDRLGAETRYEYEPVFNNVTKMTDRLGRITLYTYDARGNLTSLTDPLNHLWTFTYNSFGLLTSATDPLGHLQTMEYDPHGNMTARVDALTHRTTLEYDGIGRVTAMIDPLGRRMSMAYDNVDRLTSMTDPANTTTNFGYDETGNLISITNAQGKRWSYVYDNKERLTFVLDPLNHAAQYLYDAEDQLISVQSASGRLTRYEYDERGQRTEMVDSLGGRISYVYDQKGNLLALTDQRDNTTTFFYDELYRITKLLDPLGQSTTLTYDAVGNLRTRTDRLGRQTVYTYDGMNRPERIVYADATVDYTYDAANRLTRLDDTQSGSLLWAYDDANRVLSATMPGGVTNYTYNNANQVATMTAGDRTPVSYGYDTAGRLQTIAQGSESFTYGYDSLSRLTSMSRPNGVITNYSYDAANKLARLSHRNSANQFIEDFQYAYNPDDEIESIISLASATTLPASRTAEPADANNRVARFGDTTYGFNAEGQTTNQSNTQGLANYIWDARGRLTQAQLPNLQIVAYNYDTLGRRISRTVGSSSTTFLYDGDDVVLDRNSNNTTVDYLNGQSIDDKLRLTDSASGNSQYFMQDHLGSTVALTNSSGTITEQIQYSAFGNSNGSALTRYDFTGRERDSLTKLLYYRARWYDSQQGRFISEDPIQFEGGMNFYLYVENDSLNRIDPYGLNPLLAMAIALAYEAGRTFAEVDAKRNLFQHCPPKLPPNLCRDGQCCGENADWKEYPKNMSKEHDWANNRKIGGINSDNVGYECVYDRVNDDLVTNEYEGTYNYFPPKGFTENGGGTNGDTALHFFLEYLPFKMKKAIGRHH